MAGGLHALWRRKAAASDAGFQCGVTGGAHDTIGTPVCLEMRCGESAGGAGRAPPLRGPNAREHRSADQRRQMAAAALGVFRGVLVQYQSAPIGTPVCLEIRCGESAGGAGRAPERSGPYAREHRSADQRRQMAATADLQADWRRG